MSKMLVVRNALFSNPNIVVIDIQANCFIPSYYCSSWSETVSFVVAPKKGVYDREKLQEMMLQLVPGLEPDAKDDFYAWDTGMKFGKLYFDEQIGEEKIRREIVITDESLLAKPPEEFFGGKRVIETTKILQRRSWVYLYPNAKIALGAVHEGKNQYQIDLSELKPERFARLLYRLGLSS